MLRFSLTCLLIAWTLPLSAQQKAERITVENGGRLKLISETDREVVRMQRGPRTGCLLYTSPSPRDRNVSRMPSSA